MKKEPDRLATADKDEPCPFCGSPMQYAESSRYAEWTCTHPVCQGHADIPLMRVRFERPSA